MLWATSYSYWCRSDMLVLLILCLSIHFSDLIYSKLALTAASLDPTNGMTKNTHKCKALYINESWSKRNVWPTATMRWHKDADLLHRVPGGSVCLVSDSIVHSSLLLLANAQVGLQAHYTIQTAQLCYLSQGDTFCKKRHLAVQLHQPCNSQ